jgi:IPT/TIG domain
MKPFFILFALIVSLVFSCKTEESVTPVDSQVKFSLASSALKSNTGGRGAAAVEPKSLLITVLDPSGNTVINRKEITLYKLGDQYLSSPVTLNAIDGAYKLSEFLVLGVDNQVAYLTPREGSNLAHLVRDPLDIAFTVNPDEVIEVGPQVIDANISSNPADFGYAQFSFTTVKTINATFAGFVMESGGAQLSPMTVTIKGIRSGAPVWTYTKELEAKTNSLVIKEESSYLVTVNKTGYKKWERTLTISNQSHTEIILERVAEPTLNSIFPPVGYPNTTITLTGTNLQTSPNDIFMVSIGMTHGYVYSGTETELNINLISFPDFVEYGTFPVMVFKNGLPIMNHFLMFTILNPNPPVPPAGN